MILLVAFLPLWLPVLLILVLSMIGNRGVGYVGLLGLMLPVFLIPGLITFLLFIFLAKRYNRKNNLVVGSEKARFAKWVFRILVALTVLVVSLPFIALLFQRVLMLIS